VSQTDFLRLCDVVCSYGAWFLRIVNTGDGGVVSKNMTCIVIGGIVAKDVLCL
jgi:hypothetical protein